MKNVKKVVNMKIILVWETPLFNYTIYQLRNAVNRDHPENPFYQLHHFY